MSDLVGHFNEHLPFEIDARTNGYSPVCVLGEDDVRDAGMTGQPAGLLVSVRRWRGTLQVHDPPQPIGNLYAGLPARHNWGLVHEGLRDDIGNFLASHAPLCWVLGQHLALGHLLQIRGHGRLYSGCKQDWVRG